MNVIKIWKYFVSFCLYLTYIEAFASSLSTSGHGFEELLETEMENKECLSKPGDPIIDATIYKCERESGCNYVGKLKTSTSYEFIHEKDLAQTAKYCSILRKIIPPQNSEKAAEKIPADCEEAYKNGIKENGVVTIRLDNGESKQVYCNMKIDGGGWMVFQRRINNSTSFSRSWMEYENVFGSLDGNYWMGLKFLSKITEKYVVKLRIDLKNNEGSQGYAIYNNFLISNASEKYRLSIGGYSGNVGDSMGVANGMRFTTFDQDHDVHADKNCAVAYEGGWWFTSCFQANLNSLAYRTYPEPNTRLKKMSWFTWTNDMGTITYSEMKIKPVATS